MSNATSNAHTPDQVAAAQKAPWGPFRAVIGAVVSFFMAQEAATFLLSLYVQTRGWTSQQVESWADQSSSKFFYYVLVEVLTLSIIWLFVRGVPFHVVRKTIGLVRPRWRDVLYVLLGFVGYYVLYFAIISISNILMPIDLNQKQDIGFDQTHNSVGSLIIIAISLVVLPPIVEEIVFRGFLFRGLRRSFTPIIAALITSVLFAIPHSWQSTDGHTLWNAAIDTFSLSLVLCYLRERTGTLWAGINVHALKNLIAFLALFIFHVQ